MNVPYSGTINFNNPLPIKRIFDFAGIRVHFTIILFKWVCCFGKKKMPMVATIAPQIAVSLNIMLERANNNRLIKMFHSIGVKSRISSIKRLKSDQQWHHYSSCSVSYRTLKSTNYLAPLAFLYSWMWSICRSTIFIWPCLRIYHYNHHCTTML